MHRLSVVITNFNYERYVGSAIDSALALDWPDVEVVVVDDGSTDGSLEVIGGYGDRIRLLATENASQRVAVNRGFSLCSGDVVIFLDSDDMLPADLAHRLADVWRPTVSKAQFQMQRVDEQGRSLGEVFPDYRRVPSPTTLRRWALTTSAYPTPPGSGNAYGRWFLEKVLPVGPDLGNASDSALLAAAPFLGDVVCVPGAVVSYRQHGANDSHLLADYDRFPREVERARARWRHARAACGARPGDDRPLFRSRELLQLRIAARRLTSQPCPLPGDGRTRMLRDTLRSPLQPGPESWSRRLGIAAWCLAVLVAPAPLCERLVRGRYGRHRQQALA